MRQLHSMIPQRVDMQLEDMRAVHRESERLPPVLKAKILQPCLLSGETLIEGIRSMSLPEINQKTPPRPTKWFHTFKKDKEMRGADRVDCRIREMSTIESVITHIEPNLNQSVFYV